MKEIKSSFMYSIINNRSVILASLITLFGLAIPNHLVASWVWPWQGEAWKEEAEEARSGEAASQQDAAQARQEEYAAKRHATHVVLRELVGNLLSAGLIVYLIRTRKVIQNVVKNEVVENVVRQEVIVRSPAHELVPDLVVIDATNVLCCSSRASKPGFLPLMGLLVELQKRNCGFKCFFDANSFYKLKQKSWEDAACFTRLGSDYPDTFVEVPSGNRADDFILDYAHSHGTPIISKDHFSDYADKYTWLKTEPKRLVSFAIHSGIIQIVPLGIQAPIPAALEEAESALRAGLGEPAVKTPKYHNSKFKPAKQPVVNGATLPAMA